MIASCSRHAGEPPHILATPQFFECARIANSYVLSSKRWQEEEFRIELVPGETSPTRFKVLANDDGRSFQLEIDCAERAVVRELHAP